MNKQKFGIKKSSKWKTAGSVLLASITVLSVATSTLQASANTTSSSWADTSKELTMDEIESSMAETIKVPSVGTVKIEKGDTSEDAAVKQEEIVDSEASLVERNAELTEGSAASAPDNSQPNEDGEFTVDSLTESDVNVSRWSKVTFTEDKSQNRRRDSIVIDNLFTEPQALAAGVNKSKETSLMEGLQNWELWVWVGKKIYKVTGSDLKPGSYMMKKVLQKSDSEVYKMMLNAAKFDLIAAVSGSYTSKLADNPYEAIQYRRHFTKDMFAQLKAHKLRADLAKAELTKLGGWDSTLEADYQDVLKFYENIATMFDNMGNEVTKPMYVEDAGTNLTSSDRSKIEETYTKLPNFLANTYSKLFVLDKSNPKSKKGHILGWANNFREIHLNGFYSGYRGTLLHELGHEIDYASSEYSNNVITGSLSTSPEFQYIWKTYFNDAPDYFKNSSAEAFAEGYGRYLACKYFGHPFKPGSDYYDQEIYDYFDKLTNRLLKEDMLPDDYKVVEEVDAQDNGANYPQFVPYIRSDMTIEEHNGKLYAADNQASYLKKTITVGDETLTVYGTKPLVKSRSIGSRTYTTTTTYSMNFETGAYSSKTAFDWS